VLAVLCRRLTIDQDRISVSWPSRIARAVEKQTSNGLEDGEPRYLRRGVGWGAPSVARRCRGSRSLPQYRRQHGPDVACFRSYWGPRI